MHEGLSAPLCVKGAWVTFLGLWCQSTAVWVAQTTEIPSLSSAGWKSKVTVWAGLVFLEVQQVDGTQALSSVWWWPATLTVQLVQSLPPSAQSCPPPMSLHVCLSPFSHKDASHIGSGPMLTQCVFKLTNYPPEALGEGPSCLIQLLEAPVVLSL